MSDFDVLERQLSTAFRAADEDPRWAAPAWTDPMARIRGAARSARTQRIVVTAVALSAVSAAAVAGVAAVGSAPARVGVMRPGSVATGSGLDWLLTPARYAAYAGAHPSPSTGPEPVNSPAPPTAELDRLRRAVVDAVGAGSSTVRILRLDSADGGAAGHAIVWARLADGTPVVAERYRLDYPIEAGMTPQPAPTAAAPGDSPAEVRESFTDPATWPDGSAYTVGTGHALGYAISRDEQWSGPVVWVVTPDGWFTTWTAPVSSDRLLGWARAADEGSAAG